MPSRPANGASRFLRRLTRGPTPLPPFRNLQGDELTPSTLAVRADFAVRSLVVRRIQARLEQLALTSAELARRIGKDEGQVSKLVHGKQLPLAASELLICQALALEQLRPNASEIMAYVYSADGTELVGDLPMGFLRSLALFQFRIATAAGIGPVSPEVSGRVLGRILRELSESPLYSREAAQCFPDLEALRRAIRDGYVDFAGKFPIGLTEENGDGREEADP